MAGAGRQEQTAGDSGPELITNAAGERLSPAKVEALLKASSPLIGHAVCIGDGRPFNVALIVLDPHAREAYVAIQGRDHGSAATLAADERVQDSVALGIDLANDQLSAVEQIRRFAILPVDWRPGSDELTPAMKPKRTRIESKYAREIEWMYVAAEPGP